MDTKQHDVMDRELIASIIFAAKHSSYMVGHGRSGVSQFLAQLIGAKYRMCPSQQIISLFEDDMVLLKNLPETQDWKWYIQGDFEKYAPLPGKSNTDRVEQVDVVDRGTLWTYVRPSSMLSCCFLYLPFSTN